MTPLRSPRLPPNVLITSVMCAICRRFVRTGSYTIAPAASVYAGEPICADCIDMARAQGETGAGIGPSERKAVPDKEWHDS